MGDFVTISYTSGKHIAKRISIQKILILQGKTAFFKQQFYYNFSPKQGFYYKFQKT